MKGILLAAVLAVLTLLPTPARSITIEGGWSFPSGSFAEPTRRANVQKGAESSFSVGLKFVKPLVFLDLVGEFSYVKFGEKHRGNLDAEPQDYRHSFIPATIGLRKTFLRPLPIQPYLGAAVGLYGYMASGKLLLEEPAGTGEFTEKQFTAVIRPGLNFCAGAILDVPFSFDLAVEIKYHIMVFQGVGDDLTDCEYPYAVDADTRTFTTFMIGVLF